MNLFHKNLHRLKLALIVAAFTGSASAGEVSENARRVILVPQTGQTAVDQEIANCQGKIKAGRSVDAYAIRLGWAFVAKARLTSDPGYYKLAELCLETLGSAADSDAALLKGHIAHALHRFSEMETVARTLIAESPTRWQSFALLGDALMEQGKLEEATDAYQRMIDLRPCLQTYARVAHLRWLKGNLEGAIKLMKLAVEASSTRDPEPGAWAYARLGSYQLQKGETKGALWSAKRAMEFVPDYPAALVLEAKVLASEVKSGEAVPILQRAVAQSPLPEYQWLLADAAREAGQHELAGEVETTIRKRGRAEDPRSFALFLATRHEDASGALAAAEEELVNRQDIFTYDAIAWAALAAGDIARAKTNSEHALAEGTKDSRLFYHAGRIALAAGETAEAATWFTKAAASQQTLLPSERADLSRVASENSNTQTPSPTATNLAARGRK